MDIKMAYFSVSFFHSRRYHPFMTPVLRYTYFILKILFLNAGERFWKLKTWTIYMYIWYDLKLETVPYKQGNQRWQTSPAAPPGGLGHCQTGMCMSNFMMIGWEMAEILHIGISRKHVSVTYDLDLWPKILKIFVSHRVPILNVYVKFHDDRLRNDWDITHWNFAETQTHRHGHYNTSPSPYGGRGNYIVCTYSNTCDEGHLSCRDTFKVSIVYY